MPIDRETYNKLVKVLDALGYPNDKVRAKAAAAVDRFVERVGGWDAFLVSPHRPESPNGDETISALPDTEWCPLPTTADGCAGSWRRYNGKRLVVRECRSPIVQGVGESNLPPTIWYATVDRRQLTYSHGHPDDAHPLYHTTEFVAQQAAEAESCPDEEPLELAFTP